MSPRSITVLHAWLAVLLLPLSAATARAQDPFASDIRPTPWLSPEDERAKLHVPDGFELTCFTHEPDLWKPMNLAFDARGRLWATSSTEYPYPVKADKGFVGHDKITIHEDTNGDGVADKVTVFADDLNLAIGLYPCVDAKGHDSAIVFSVPNIWRLWDDDGDGRSDRREVLYGPFGWERDAHGLNNSFRRGADGWVYACHGYNNRTTVKGTDGHEIHMESGNSYRFKLDGSRIEQFTFGQVNPFGSCFDERGDLLTADCHTLPITMLLRGGCYDSFGKPSDGLGYAPQIMKYLHGSTALCGLAIACNENFPPEYRGDVFVGNVMTCRVHHDKLVYAGSTPHAVEQPDFIVSDDPWFRPVDVTFGFDGALYVADFYNRIIGHYEVPLDHPGRDRTSGRIWRVAAKRPVGKPGEAAAKVPDLRGMTAEELERELGNPNLVIRSRALDELSDRVAPDDASHALTDFNTHEGEQRKALILRAHQRAGRGGYALALGQGERPEHRDRRGFIALKAETAVRLSCAQVGADEPFDDPKGRDRNLEVLTIQLTDPDPFVRRAAAVALGMHPDSKNVAPLLALFHATPIEDELLRHATRIALRNQLAEPTVFAEIADATQHDWSAADRAVLLGLAPALHGDALGRFLLDHFGETAEPPLATEEWLRHIAEEAAPADLPRLIERVRRDYAADVGMQLDLCETILAALDRRGAAADAATLIGASWAPELIDRLLATPAALTPSWHDLPVAGCGKSDNPWCLQTRGCADGKEAPFLCTLPHGETLTGTLVSAPFTVPAKLTFFLAGHNGELDRAALAMNRVRVVDAASGALLAETLAPRNDIAQRIELDFTAPNLVAHVGKLARLELVDGNPYDAYAWLAVGRFEPAIVALPEIAPADVATQTRAALRLAARVPNAAHGATLVALAESAAADPAVRAQAVTTLLAAGPISSATPLSAGLASALAALIDDPDAPADLRDALCHTLVSPAENSGAAALELAGRCIAAVPSRMQPALALALARTPGGPAALLALVESGKATATLLQNDDVKSAVVSELDRGAAPDAPKPGSDKLAALTRSLPPADEARAKKIEQFRREFRKLGGNAAEGANVFTKNCVQCHSLGGVGAKIGPQLDGLRSRGFERLFEDLLDPNRNVDIQFRRTNLFLADGDVLSVLVRRTEGATLVYADELGKEHSLPTTSIKQQRESRLSLMPGNFDEVLTEQSTRDLVAYLLAAK